MANKVHDTFFDLEHGTPVWFSWAARLLPIGLLAQFLSAGTALFQNDEFWGVHATVGLLLVIPVLALVGGAVIAARLRGFGWWVSLLFLLYLVQVVLAVGAEPFGTAFDGKPCVAGEGRAAPRTACVTCSRDSRARWAPRPSPT